MRPPLNQLIEDLFALCKLCDEDLDPNSPQGQLVFSYLAANAGLLVHTIQRHYKVTSQEDRLAAVQQNAMIDGSTVFADFEGIALEAVKAASQCWTGLNRIHLDNLQMLIRSLQAIQHHQALTGTLQEWGSEAVLLISPVSDYWPVWEAVYDSAKRGN